MGAISRRLSRFCSEHPNLGIPGLMKYIVIANVGVFILDLFSSYSCSYLLQFNPALIFQGEIWRLLTFLIVPMNLSPIWFALSTLLYYSIGTTLEQYWGPARFTIYYIMGAYVNVILALIMQLISPSGYAYPIMTYVNQSLFFAFATLYPETRFMIYFIIPVKAKWLAWLSGAFIIFDFVSYLFAAEWLGAVIVFGTVLNYLIFFWDDIKSFFHNRRAQAAHFRNPQTVNFKKAQREIKQNKGYLHKCTICGVTDADNPEMEFRYCSRCNGYYCYCMDHINNHVHIE